MSLGRHDSGKQDAKHINLPLISSEGFAEMKPVKPCPTSAATSIKIAFSSGIMTSSALYPGFVSTVYENDETMPSPDGEPLHGICSPFLKQMVSNEGVGTGTGLTAGGATGFFVGFFVGGGTGLCVGFFVGSG